MDTYPKNTQEFERRFCDDESCFRYIFALRWPDGYQCPYCGSHGTSWLRKGLTKIRCGKCRHDYSIMSGTIFQDSHISMQTWFRVMWHICLQKNGISALGIQRSLGLSSYQTAWLCLHKLRKAMIRQGRERLSGKVEVDEAYIGGVREGKRGRGADGKQIVFFAVENKDITVDNKKRLSIGRIRLLCIPDVTAESLLAAIEETVCAGYSKILQMDFCFSVVVTTLEQSFFGGSAPIPPGFFRHLPCPSWAWKKRADDLKMRRPNDRRPSECSVKAPTIPRQVASPQRLPPLCRMSLP